MSKMFKKFDGHRRNNRPSNAKKEPEDIMDPVLYIGGLDKEKYPQLPLQNESKVEEEIENPLNQR